MNTRSSESLCLDGGKLGSLSFDWGEDRYQHTWNFPESGLRLRSVESNSSHVWPLSPPLQQIHQQSFGDGREVIFGVGMSGRGHWSASFTLVPDLACWIVEFACRTPVEPDCLLSTYEASCPLQAESDTLYQHPGNPVITLEAVAPSTISSLDAERVSFSPAELNSGEVTRQWAFRLKVKHLP